MREMKPSGVDWIGEIPSSWKVAPLKYGASCSSDLSTYTADDSKEFLALENVESWTGRLVGLDERPDSVDSSVSVFSETDVLFGKLRPYLAKVCRPDFRGVCSTELLCVSPMSYCCDYLFWLLISKGFIDVINAESYGVKMPRTSWAQMGAHYCPVPPLSEQQAIAGHLDVETAKIDQAMSLLRRELETLEQFKKSVIHETVTKGLDPTVPMKPSGVEWIGEIPEHWVTKRLRYVASAKTGQTPPSDDPTYFDGPVTWYTPNDINNDHVDTSARTLTLKAISERRAPLISAGVTLFVGIGATIGKVGFSNSACSFNQQITALPTYVDSAEWLFYVMQAQRDFIVGQAMYTTLPIVNNGSLGDLLLPIPPGGEQSEIAVALNKRISHIDQIVAVKKLQSETLARQRESLIFEYVTGKRRVSEVA